MADKPVPSTSAGTTDLSPSSVDDSQSMSQYSDEDYRELAQLRRRVSQRMDAHWPDASNQTDG
jgi:hypothetical protein